jgi:hypothetical protein
MEEAKEEEASDPSSYVVWPGTCAHAVLEQRHWQVREREREQSEWQVRGRGRVVVVVVVVAPRSATESWWLYYTEGRASARVWLWTVHYACAAARAQAQQHMWWWWWWWAARDDHRVTVSERNRSMEILFSSLLSQSQLLSSVVLEWSIERGAISFFSTGTRVASLPVHVQCPPPARVCAARHESFVSMVVIVAGRWSSSSASFWSPYVAIDRPVAAMVLAGRWAK